MLLKYVLRYALDLILDAVSLWGPGAAPTELPV